MDISLEKHFKKIGAKLNVVKTRPQRQGFTSRRNEDMFQLDIVVKDGLEMFEIQIPEQNLDNLELSILEVKPKDRHLVLLARELGKDGVALKKEHFLCGHDERHLFVASVEGVSTVRQAKDSLKPASIRRNEVGLNEKKRNRRKNKHFKRQGEWFFIPEEITPDPAFVIRNEPLSRGNGSKPHMAQFCYRSGGEAVKVSSQYPNGLTIAQWKKLIARRPKLRNLAWQDMRRGAAVYVKGKIRHEDHATITLNQWHSVLMNTERFTETVAFLD